MTKRNVLLIGATGILGNAFINKHGESYDIIGVSRGSKDIAENEKCQYFLGDIISNTDEIIQDIIDIYGGVDLVINAIGHSMYEASSKDESIVNCLEDLIKNNFLCQAKIMNAVFHKYWKKQGYKQNISNNANIVNIGAFIASNTILMEGEYKPHYSFAYYAATKSALETLTRYISAEYEQYGVRVNCLSPSGFPKYLTPEYVADSIVEIDNSDINGEVKVIYPNGDKALIPKNVFQSLEPQKCSSPTCCKRPRK